MKCNVGITSSYFLVMDHKVWGDRSNTEGTVASGNSHTVVFNISRDGTNFVPITASNFWQLLLNDKKTVSGLAIWKVPVRARIIITFPAFCSHC